MSRLQREIWTWKQLESLISECNSKKEISPLPPEHQIDLSSQLKDIFDKNMTLPLNENKINKAVELKKSQGKQVPVTQEAKWTKWANLVLK